MGALGFVLLTACAPTAAPSASTVGTVATAVASPVATVIAASPVRITGAQVSSSDTVVTIQNAGSATVDLTGWSLRVGSASAALPGNSRAAPGETVTIHTASGTSGARDIYLGSAATALLGGLQPGATMTLLDAQGTPVSELALPR